MKMKTLLEMLGMSFRTGIVGDEPGGAPEVTAEPTDQPTEPTESDPSTPPDPGAEDQVPTDESSATAWEDEFERKGPQNIIMENRRKGETITQLKARLAELEGKATPPAAAEPKKTDEPPKDAPKSTDAAPAIGKPVEMLKFLRNSEVKGHVEKLAGIGMDDDALESLAHVMAYITAQSIDHSTKPLRSRFIESDFREAIDKFSGQDKYKFGMSKIGKEVEAFIRKEYRQEHWNNEEVIKSTYGLIIAEHPELIGQTAPKRTIVEPEAPTGGEAGGVKQVGGVSSHELQRYAVEIGYSPDDLKDASVRKSVTEAYAAMKKATGK